MKLGMQELIIILVVVIIIFGPTQIPKLTRMFGKSIKGLREGMNSVEEEEKLDKTDKPNKKDQADKAAKDANQEEDG